MRSGEDLNHVTPDLDLALIEGSEVTALCGVRFLPTLRVGSGGRADEPAFTMCPECLRVDELLAEIRAIRSGALVGV